MAQTAKPSESARPTNDGDPGDRPDWWFVLLTSGLCVAGAIAAVVLTLLF